MKSFLVIGLGRFGRAVACELGSLGHEVLALDNSEENVQHIADSVTQAVCGDAQDESVLASLGVRNFDCCVVAIGTDIEASILVTVMLKELGAKQVVCKALSALHARVLERVGAEIKTVLVRRGFESGELRQAEKQGAAMYCAEDALFCLASEVESPQNVIFSCMQPQWDAAALDDREQVLLLDGLQDPGNLGTILRTAEAFALGAVVLCEGCADPFSPKVVRSTMGAVFRLPCVQLPLADALARLKTAGLPVYATALHEDSVPLSSVSLGRAAVIIGSEGRGVSESALRLSDRRVIIPMHGRAESLNAGVAAAIVIYEMTK